MGPPDPRPARPRPLLAPRRRRVASCVRSPPSSSSEALAQSAAWRAAGHRLAVSVNISATNLLDPGLIEEIRRLLGRYGLPAEALVVEVTETCVISEFERSSTSSESFEISGSSSPLMTLGPDSPPLAYLSSLAVGELKLDRIFVAGLAAEEKGTGHRAGRRRHRPRPRHGPPRGRRRASKTAPRSTCSAGSGATSPRDISSAGRSPPTGSSSSG